MIRFFFKGCLLLFVIKLGRSRKSFEHFCNILVKKQKQIHPISTASICSKCLCLPEKIQIKVLFKGRGVGGLFVVGVDVFGQVADATLSL